MSTEKDVRELVIVNELSQLLGKAFTIYNKATGEAFGLDGQAVINIASATVDKSQNIPLDSGSTTKVPVVAAVESELSKKVSLSGNEIIAGAKTFSSSPIVPNPTAAKQAASKKYVDDSVAARQAALTFGIADANAVKINDADVAVGDYARFTALGLQGRSAAEVVSDLGAEVVANKNVAGGYAGLDSGGKVLPELLPDFVLGQVRYGGTFSSTGVIVSEYASLNGQNISSIAAADYFGYYFIALASITVHGYSFYVGDWLISNGSAGWGKVDNTDAVTTVAGRTGAITLTKSDITDFPNKWAWEDLSGVPVTFAPSSHSHEWADLTNPPASYTPSAHVHGNISNDGKIGTTADYVVVTGSGGTLTTASRAGIDSRSSFTPSAHSHNDLYYTETEIANFFSGAAAISGYNRSNWDTAHGWGNHASAGYASAATLSSHISDTSPHLSADERNYFNKLKQYLLFAADNSSMYSTLNFYSESGVSAFGIGTGGGGGGVGVDVIDDLFSVRIDAALSANQGRILKGLVDSKQPQLNGTGLVRMSGTGITYDNTSYATVSQLSGYATTSSLSNYSLTSHTHNSFYTKYLYPNNIVQSTTAETLSGNNENFTAMFDAPSIFVGSGSYANAFVYTGYNQYGSTQLITLYNATNGNNRMAFRVYNQSIGGYNNFTEVWTKDNLTNTLTPGYLPYWNGSSLSDTYLSINSSGVLFNSISASAHRYFILNKTSGYNGGILWKLSGSEKFQQVITNTGDMDFYSYTYGGVAVRFLANGNVGIGTTIPQFRLESEGGQNTFAASFSTTLSTGNFTGIHFGYRENNTSYRKSALVFERKDDAARGTIHILNNGNCDSSSATLSDAKLSITYGGNVGIGYSSDQGYKLAVNGSGYFNGNITASGSGSFKHLLILDGTTNAQEFLYRRNGLLRWDIISYEAETGGNTGSNYHIYRYDDNGNYLGLALAINRANGNVTIGNNSISYDNKLYVNGSGYFNGSLTNVGHHFIKGVENKIYFDSLGAENAHSIGGINSYDLRISNSRGTGSWLDLRSDGSIYTSGVFETYGHARIGFNGSGGIYIASSSRYLWPGAGGSLSLGTSGIDRIYITGAGFSKMSNTGYFSNVSGSYHEILSDSSLTALISNEISSGSADVLYLGFRNLNPDDNSRFLNCYSTSGSKFLLYASGRVWAANYIESASYLKGTSIKIGENWEAIPSGTSDAYLDLKYNGVLKARLDSSGNITAVGGVTAFAV